ncbi:quinone-dependent dihydroorotate dehydrogenase [Paraferrimonas sp. SM1919]|uniref:quinone-dependent dihydroorotate dehydrogenase n=1 Tax=Paraferrimonas sp. SM1919 TaxID=2662263 RepID=UPI0013D05CC4|nr:quinone-dependent dihydroorotate dehydrogenase [Paraferrimonas sp. SM1919]
MFYKIAQKIMFQMDPELAHEFSIKSLGLTGKTPLNIFYKQTLPKKPVEVMGITFPNIVGLAAGLDKNGECIDAFADMGFGHVEVGTVTPKAQPGNDKPRLFRLKPAKGIINRMGFNNNGVDALVANIKAVKSDVIIGVNIGKNKDTPVENGKDDYLICMDKVYDVASYITVNISSPNTPGLRSLQYGELLDELLSSLKQKQLELAEKYGKYVPLALKIAPDLSDEEIESIAGSILRNKMDCAIATNTTLDREAVAGLEHCDEAGGLSGLPVRDKSTEVVAKLYSHLKDQVPIIGVGGINSAEDAQQKLDAGAKLVQVYSGFIYNGPELIKEIVNKI